MELPLKNWLFIGHENAGKRAATFYTIVENCKRLKIDTYQYMTEVLNIIIEANSLNEVQYEDLLPKIWIEKQKPEDIDDRSAA